jgi:hypothetical protein
MDRDARRDVKVLIKQVDAILWTFWNPISCGVPEDEYSSYAPAVAALLIDERPTEEVAAYLSRIREEAMGMPPNEYADHTIAVRLRALVTIQ